MENIKLVIWDLDETFWKGTLAENEQVEILPENKELVRELNNRGIMNSIVSKNDFEKAAQLLKKNNIFDEFIFPQISWNSKGETVKKLLEIIHLRAYNTLFIDDNSGNLKEVEFYNQGINAVTPDYIVQNNILNLPQFKGKSDKEHTRLKQYQILEQKYNAEQTFSSNEGFLRSSHIKLSFGDNFTEEAVFNRVAELIQRTNQLNYTKKRITSEELKLLFLDKDVNAKYISVKDDYGDYGIVGFFTVKNGILEHFLFSCRTLGMGIESFVYQKLGCPNITINGDVAVQLDLNKKIDWIEITNTETNWEKGKKTNTPQLKVLMVAGCDLEQAYFYMQGNKDILLDKEFATVAQGREIRTSDTWQLTGALKYRKEINKELCEKLPFCEDGITFSTKIYSGNYDYVILSVVDDYIRDIFESKKDHSITVGVSAYFENVKVWTSARYGQHSLIWLYENFVDTGKPVSLGKFRENLEFIRNYIPEKTKLILINGCEIDLSDVIGKERCERNIEMNRVVDDFLKDVKNVYLLDMRKIITSRTDLAGLDNRHYTRNAYYKMAGELSKQIAQLSNGTKIFIDKKKFIGEKIKDKTYRKVISGLRKIWHKIKIKYKMRGIHE